jgi:hypothetical protein
MLGILLFVTFLFQACKDDPEEGTLVLHFKPFYDDQPLQLLITHPYDSPQRIQFTHMSMFISDLSLYDQSGDETLDDIELVDVSFSNLPSAEAGYTMTLTGVPARTYDGIKFGMGVPPDINQMKPADFPSSSPLSLTGYYWAGWQSYIFMKTEGHLDSLGNGPFDTGFALHTGSDELFRILNGPVPIVIEDGKETVLNIGIDYKKLLAGVDIKGHPQNHTPQDTSELVKIVNNFTSAITLFQ